MNIYNLLRTQIQYCINCFSSQYSKKDYKGIEVTNKHVAHYLNDSMKRFKLLIQMVQKYSSDPMESSVLEIGASYGTTLLALKELGYDVSGAEIEDNIPNYCIPLDKKGIAVKAWDLHYNNCPFDNNSFDIVIASEVFEHLLIGLKGAVEKCAKLLKPGGHLIVTTPNLYRAKNIFKISCNRSIIESFSDKPKFKNGVIIDTRIHPREPVMKELISACQTTELKPVHHKYFSSSVGLNIRNIIHSISFPRWRSDLLVVARKEIGC
jgi:2-polyprenyl-3-methyl-5-hydroxy-6-metoxy-1,4-benzoquinol methylase